MSTDAQSATQTRRVTLGLFILTLVLVELSSTPTVSIGFTDRYRNIFSTERAYKCTVS